MAIGDAGFNAFGHRVLDAGDDSARIRWGAQEINRTRDFLAQVKGMIPTSKQGYRDAAGIMSGTADPKINPPAGAVNGDLYFMEVQT